MFLGWLAAGLDQGGPAWGAMVPVLLVIGFAIATGARRGGAWRQKDTQARRLRRYERTIGQTSVGGALLLALLIALLPLGGLKGVESELRSLLLWTIVFAAAYLFLARLLAEEAADDLGAALEEAGDTGKARREVLAEDERLRAEWPEAVIALGFTVLAVFLLLFGSMDLG